MSVLGRRSAVFRFYGELNDFLPSARRFISFAHHFELSASVKDVIESMGVPHTEVGLILLDGTPVDFSHLVRDGDRVSVCPEFQTLDTTLLPHLRPPLQQYRFVLDTHLGRLATYLRMVGFDTLYDKTTEDKELAGISHDEERILLTRDIGLLKRSEVVHGYFVRATEPKQQLVEVLRRFKLLSAIVPFQRCLRCNVLLKPVPKEAIAERLGPKTRQYFEDFQICPVCNRIYWSGSHYQHMQGFVEYILAQNADVSNAQP